ncbi:MAG: 50S ribosomal protein L21 [Clostridiaceae bacterium]|nr:50S ribosomal protein L21 [Clostridiaceae bacterium]
MNYAIILTGGKQYRVAVGDEVFVEKLDVAAEEEIIFDQVLAVHNGDRLTVGDPLVEGASVKAELVKHGRGKKIYVMKYKSKKGYRRKQGHRQPYTKVRISEIVS